MDAIIHDCAIPAYSHVNFLPLHNFHVIVLRITLVLRLVTRWREGRGVQDRSADGGGSQTVLFRSDPAPFTPFGRGERLGLDETV